MNRYRGTIITVDQDEGDFAFIDISTVRMVNGLSHDLPTTEDVFIHHSECEWRFEVGSEVTFAVEKDRKRVGAFRAVGAIMVSSSQVEGGVETHFDQRLVDHPMVPIRWCIKPEVLHIMQNMQNHPYENWYLAIVAQKEEGDQWHEPIFQTVVGLERIGDGRGYLTFHAPGTYILVTYLVATTLSKSKIKRRLQEVDSRHIRLWQDREKNLLLNDSDNLVFLACYWDKVVAFSSTRVEVPEGIFAEPLPAWKKAWLGYFNLDKPDDECSTRGLMPLALTLGVFWYILWETSKRTWMLVLGVLHFLAGGNPLPIWKAAVTRNLSAYLSDFWAKWEFKTMTKWSGWKRFLHPSVMVSLLGLVVGLTFLPVHIRTVGVTTLITLGLFAGIMYLAERYGSIAGKKLGVKIGEGMQSIRANKRERMELRLAYTKECERLKFARVVESAVCGNTSTKEPVTIELVWSGIKRRVCRTYAR